METLKIEKIISDTNSSSTISKRASCESCWNFKYGTENEANKMRGNYMPCANCQDNDEYIPIPKNKEKNEL